jgi:multidrug resistance efflux pump
MWLGVMLRLRHSAATDQLANLVDLVAAGLENDRFQVAVTEVANELAARFDSHRVSLGFRRLGSLQVAAISHSAQIHRRTRLTRAMRDAMTEAMDQGATIVYPPLSDNALQVTHFHKQLAQIQPGTALCSVPLVKEGRAVGAILLERDAGNGFDPETVAHCEQVGLLLGPVLETRRSDERPLAFNIVEAVGRSLAKLFGPRHLALKLATFLVTAVLVMATVAPGTFRISSDTELEASMCRSIIAPQSGYIASANVRAGDRVQGGQLLASLDDRDLLQEQRKWQSQSNQLHKEYRKALAAGDRAEVAILKARRAQAEAQLMLVTQQLERIHLKAPFSGMVVSGDLSQSLGAPVERGEVLYEVAPTNDFRVVLRVDDRDIGFVAAGQRGTLKLTGIPDRGLGITIDRLTPVAASEAGRTYFRVEALLEAESDLMRPGMAGIAKIEVGREKLWWIWTRRLLDWTRIFLWNRLP